MLEKLELLHTPDSFNQVTQVIKPKPHLMRISAKMLQLMNLFEE